MRISDWSSDVCSSDLRWSYDSNVAITGVDGTAGHGGTIASVGAIAAGGNLLLNSAYDSFGSSNRYQAGPGNVLYVWRLASPCAENPSSVTPARSRSSH